MKIYRAPESDYPPMTRVLTIDGLSDGRSNAVGSGTSALDYKVKSLAGERILLKAVNFRIYASPGLGDSVDFGKGDALGSPLFFYFKDDLLKQSVMHGRPVTTNGDLYLWTTSVLFPGAGMNVDSLVSRWDFDELFGGDGLLLKEGDEFGFHVDADIPETRAATVEAVAFGLHLGTPNPEWITDVS